MIAATRQDLQTALDRTRNTILGTVFSRNEAQTVLNQLRNGILQDLRELHAENQATVRLAQTQHEQILQRVTYLQQQIVRLQEQHAQTLNILHNSFMPNGTLKRY